MQLGYQFLPSQPSQAQPTFLPLHISPPFFTHSSSLLSPFCQRCQVLITVKHLIVECLQYHAACQQVLSLYFCQGCSPSLSCLISTCDLHFLTHTDCVPHVFLCFVLVPRGHSGPDAGYCLFIFVTFSLLPPLSSHHLPTGTGTVSTEKFVTVHSPLDKLLKRNDEWKARMCDVPVKIIMILFQVIKCFILYNQAVVCMTYNLSKYNEKIK